MNMMNARFTHSRKDPGSYTEGDFFKFYLNRSRRGGCISMALQNCQNKDPDPLYQFFQERADSVCEKINFFYTGFIFCTFHAVVRTVNLKPRKFEYSLIEINLGYTVYPHPNKYFVL